MSAVCLNHLRDDWNTATALCKPQTQLPLAVLQETCVHTDEASVLEWWIPTASVTNGEITAFLRPHPGCSPSCSGWHRQVRYSWRQVDVCPLSYSHFLFPSFLTHHSQPCHLPLWGNGRLFLLWKGSGNLWAKDLSKTSCGFSLSLGWRPNRSPGWFLPFTFMLRAFPGLSKLLSEFLGLCHLYYTSAA